MLRLVLASMFFLTVTVATEAQEPATAPPNVSDASKNQPVPPGLVRWHDDFAAACAASERTGKPVLLFQLLGRLDQEYT